MESCFYEGFVTHRRQAPVEHAFRYRHAMVYVDLAELDEAFGRRGLWSTQFPAPARFRRADYLGGRATPLNVAVRDLVERRIGSRPAGPIRLLTNFRSFGFAMNPVSFYYCFAADGTSLQWLVAEVSNTPWNERHYYVVACDPTREARPEVCKEFHVSPFLEMALTYRWQIAPPGERLTLAIEASPQAGGRPFHASLALTRVPLTARTRLKMLLRYPLATWRVYLGIYRQALSLWWKGVPFVPHPKQTALDHRSASSPEPHDSSTIPPQQSAAWE